MIYKCPCCCVCVPRGCDPHNNDCGDRQSNRRSPDRALNKERPISRKFDRSSWLMSAYGMNCPPAGQAALVCLLLAPCNVRFGGNPDITNTRAVSTFSPT